MRLREFQRRFIYRLYEFYPETGRRRYKSALWGLAKGNGKTPLAAFIGAYELLGAGIIDPEVLIGAGSLDQANRVFGTLKTSVSHENSPMIDQVIPLDLELQLVNRPGVGKRIAAVAGTNDGADATVFIGDELHEWLGKLARVHMVVEGALKREEAFSLSISTAGYDKTSLLGQKYDRGVAIAQGDKIDDETLFEWFEAPGGLDPDDPQDWEAGTRAANPAIGDFNAWSYVKSRFDGALVIPRFEWLRYHWNRFTESPEQWLPPGAWAADEVDVGVSKDAPMVLAFSGSWTGTSAGLVGCTPEGHIFTIRSWEPPPNASVTWQVPRADVVAAVEDAIREYRAHLGGVFCNVPGWESEFQDLQEVYKPNLVVEWPVRSRPKFAAACTEFYSAAVSGALTHDGDEAMDRHLRAAAPRRFGEQTYIIQGTDEAVIELAKAAVIAYAERHAKPKRRGGMMGVTV